MDLEEGVKALWKEGIYADSGMGCTGPVILVSDANLEKAKEILKKAGYIN
ncbi:Glycine/sarcosine/betaine reductase complex component C subunit alpha [Clostridium sp. C105KSO13]|nr:Glycine/sarcosine/betaine reductase complex component C subunit alpha [Clostridium sp. C105KSO13]